MTHGVVKTRSMNHDAASCNRLRTKQRVKMKRNLPSKPKKSDKRKQQPSRNHAWSQVDPDHEFDVDDEVREFPGYVSVHEQHQRAEHALATLRSQGELLTPVRASKKAIATSVWGRAWCRHLETWSDYETRLPRGRSYLRQGCVLDLQISNGGIQARVQGSQLYTVQIRFQPLEPEHWDAVKQRCRGGIDSLIDLLQGKLPQSVMQSLTDPDYGVFPPAHAIKMSCTCLDDADLCKHVAAVLYGVGIRLDQEPTALFVLRNVDHSELLEDAVENALSPPAIDETQLKEEDLEALFNLELDPDDP